MLINLNIYAFTSSGVTNQFLLAKTTEKVNNTNTIRSLNSSSCLSMAPKTNQGIDVLVKFLGWSWFERTTGGVSHSFGGDFVFPPTI